jgi:hypothetical protein
MGKWQAERLPYNGSQRGALRVFSRGEGGRVKTVKTIEIVKSGVHGKK